MEELVKSLEAAVPLDFKSFSDIVDEWGSKYKISPPPVAKKMGKEKFLKFIFDHLDANDDGKISAAEL